MSRVGTQNAAKRAVDASAGPWKAWRTRSRHARAIRWIETFCAPSKGHGARKPLKLAPFQKAWLEEVLEDDVTSAALSIPRGNGKSSLLAALALWALFDDDATGSPQVPVVATTIGQSIRSCYGVALAMLDAAPALSDRSLTYSASGKERVYVPANGGELFPIAADAAGLQGLDPSLAIADEIGFLPVESWDALLLASGKRPRSLVAAIGTPGIDRDNALWHLRQRAEIGAPGFSFTEYAAQEGCDIHDVEEWHRANPAIAAGFLRVDALFSAVALSPEAAFRVFRLGQWVDGVASWLGDDGRSIWDGLEDDYEMLPGVPTWAGVDVALKHDSSAVVVAQRRPDGRLHVAAKIWEPRADGRLDVSDVMAFLRDLDANVELKAAAYDPRFFDLAAQQLLDEGLAMVEFPQVLERLTPAVGATFEAIRRSEITHDDDPLFTRHVLAAQARLNERGFTLSKSKSRDRIDAAVAMCMATAVALYPAPEIIDPVANVH